MMPGTTPWLAPKTTPGSKSRVADHLPLRLYPARNFWARLRGLHAFNGLAWHKGLWLSPCNAVHSFGLAYPIDVVFLNNKYRIKKQVQNMQPNRIAFCRGAFSVVELPAGYCADQAQLETQIRRALCRVNQRRPV